MVRPLSLLALLGLSVDVHSFIVAFNNPQQCGDLRIAWTERTTSAAQLDFPLFLHILSFDSPVVPKVEIPGWNKSVASGSTVVPKFPLRSGVQYLLSITDSIGQGVASVSSVQTTANSSDTSCLPSLSPSAGQFQVFTAQDSDCPSLEITWNNTIKVAPSVAVFSPGSHPVDLSAEIAMLGDPSVRSTGDFTSLSQVVVLFVDNAKNTSHTSQLLTVGGADRTNCARVLSGNIISVSAPPAQPLVSNGAARVIGGVSAGILGLSIVLFTIFSLRRWWQRVNARPILPTTTDPSAPSPETDSSQVVEVKPRVSLLQSQPPVAPASQPEAEVVQENDRPSEKAISLHEKESESPPSAPPAHACPVAFPKYPRTARRRSHIARASPTIASSTVGSEYSDFSSLPGSEPHLNLGEARPDSPTLADSIRNARRSMSSLLAQASITSKSSKSSSRSHRSRRSQYPKLDTTFDSWPPFVVRLPNSNPSSPNSTKSRSQQSEKRSQYTKLDEEQETSTPPSNASTSKRPRSSRTRSHPVELPPKPVLELNTTLSRFSFGAPFAASAPTTPRSPRTRSRPPRRRSQPFQSNPGIESAIFPFAVPLPRTRSETPQSASAFSQKSSRHSQSLGSDTASNTGTRLGGDTGANSAIRKSPEPTSRSRDSS